MEYCYRDCVNQCINVRIEPCCCDQDTQSDCCGVKEQCCCRIVPSCGCRCSDLSASNMNCCC